MKIAIVGGGIAGLSAGLLLERKGNQVQVLERAKALNRNGFGFVLLQNGLQALKEMGLKDAMIQAGHPLEVAVIKDHKGNIIRVEKLEDTLSIKRNACVKTLADELSPGTILFGQSPVGYNESGEIVESIQLDNGKELDTDILIGSDGVNSGLRNKLFPERELSPVRIKEFVTTVRNPYLVKRLKGTFSKTLDHNRRLAFGVLPCNDEELIWFMQYHPGDGDLMPGHFGNIREFIEEKIGDWPDPIPEILQSTDFRQVYNWRTRDLDLLPSFHKGNTVLIGDAAHVSLTLTSQGANSALVDAVLLTNSIQGISNDQREMDKAFSNFYLSRKNLLSGYLEMGRKMADDFLNYHKDGDIRLPLVS